MPYICAAAPELTRHGTATESLNSHFERVHRTVWHLDDVNFSLPCTAVSAAQSIRPGTVRSSFGVASTENPPNGTSMENPDNKKDKPLKGNASSGRELYAQHGWLLVLASLIAYCLHRIEGIGGEIHELVSRHRYAGMATAVALMAIHTASSIAAPQGELGQAACTYTASKTFEAARFANPQHGLCDLAGYVGSAGSVPNECCARHDWLNQSLTHTALRVMTSQPNSAKAEQGIKKRQKEKQQKG